MTLSKGKQDAKTAKKVSAKKVSAKKVSAKKTKKVSTKNTGTRNEIGPVYVDGFMHLSPLDLARYELAQSRVVLISQSIEIKKGEALQQQQALNDRIRRINSEIVQLTADGTERQRELKELQAEFEELYGISFSKVLYDDQTGRISVVEEGKDPEPIPELTE